MSKTQVLRTLVMQRLNVAVEEIFQLFEKTIAEYEEICRAKENNVRLQGEQLAHSEVAASFDVQQLVANQEEEPANSSCIKVEEQNIWSSQNVEQLPALKEEPHVNMLAPPDVQLKSEEDKDVQLVLVESQEMGDEPAEPPHIKEEEVWNSQACQEAGITMLTLSGVHVKTEDNNDGQPRQSEDNQGGRSGQCLSAEAEDLHSRANYLAPLSDPEDMTSRSSDTVNTKVSYAKKAKKRKCSECGKTFVCKSDLKKHMVTHTGEKAFACSVCNKRFPFKHRMLRHMSIHTGEHAHSCSVCGKGFRDRYDMEGHMSKHTGQKLYSCSICAKSLSCRASLRNHMKLHTGKKLHTCPVCGKGLSGGSSFGAHVRKHTGEKPFVCPVCNKCFSRKDTLALHIKRHNKRHTGEKPFACSVCPQRFTRKSAIKHTDGKLFICSLCLS
ncbi:zinc finger protein 454-like [Syngnathus acus]|uniref:zinc finger protein 454-like n=1 Tax=Syngnathus acus TaxID=161584 RepID=UPI001885B7EC|nr:zinc finger protein 454-like [Syngnathus acus]